MLDDYVMSAMSVLAAIDRNPQNSDNKVDALLLLTQIHRAADDSHLPHDHKMYREAVWELFTTGVICPVQGQFAGRDCYTFTEVALTEFGLALLRADSDYTSPLMHEAFLRQIESEIA